MDPRRVDVPGYRVLRSLGAGGMGAVFLVEPEGLPGTVRALKVVHAQDAARRARFLREAELLARLDHCPGVIRVHDAGERGDTLWICMEHVDGGDLAEALIARGPLPWNEAVRLGRDVALGLAAVHERGVVHRDIKPANVLLDAQGAPKLVDFGIAQATDLERLTLSGAMVGTPAFFSPEQARGQPIDGRSDVYSLGATLYEVLTGTIPFSDDQGLPALLDQLLTAEPAPPSAHRVGVPRAVDAVVLGALAKDPGRRPDAREFARQLDACLDPHAAGAPRGWTRGRRRALVLTLAAAPGVALAGLAMTIQNPVVAGPVAPPPSAAKPPAQTPDPFEPLLTHVRRGRLLEAVAWINQAGDLRGERGPTAATAEAAVRRELAALVAATPPRLEDLAVGLAIIQRLRQRAGLAPAADALADALLERFCQRMHQLERVAAGTQAPGEETFDPSPDIAALEALCDSGLLLDDRVCGDRALDAALTVWTTTSALTATQYQRILGAMVRLDVDLHRDHVMRLGPIPSTVPRGAWTEYVDLRIKSEELLAESARRETARGLVALVDGPRGASLGPVTRAHGLWLGVAGVNDSEAALKLLDRASELDPSSPWPAYQKTVLHLEWRHHDEAARWAHEAITRLQRGDQDSRPTMVQNETFLIYRACVRAFIRVGDLARARDLFTRLASFRAEYAQLGALKEELESALSVAPGAPGRQGEF